MNKKNILGVGITDATKQEVLEYIVENVENFKKKLLVVTPNPEFLVLANKDNVFRNILNGADLALADGVGVMIAAKIMGKPLKERFTGIDLVKSLCNEVSEKPITVGFLGGRGRVAELTAECLRKIHPKLKVVFVGEDWPDNLIENPSRVTSNASEAKSGRTSWLESLTGDVSSSKFGSTLSTPTGVRVLLPKNIDILFVAFGAPKQEFWISENLNKIPVKVAIGVGGAFDYISGKIPRAPRFIRNIGFEWLFRLVVQPWRMKRQLSLIKFAWLIAKEKISKN